MHRHSNTINRGAARRRLSRMPLAAAICLTIAAPAFAQDASAPSSTAPPKDQKVAELSTVTVTAQKRTENLQKVPISIQVLGTEKIEQLHIANFDDYVKYLPSVSYQSLGPGFSEIYMRGIASDQNGKAGIRKRVPMLAA